MSCVTHEQRTHQINQVEHTSKISRYNDLRSAIYKVHDMGCYKTDSSRLSKFSTGINEQNGEDNEL